MTGALGRVLVVGFGFIGSSLVRKLVTISPHVSVLHRSPLSFARSPDFASVRFFRGDASELDTIGDSIGPIENIIWCAGSSLPANSEANVVESIDSRLVPFDRALKYLAPRAKRISLVSSGGAVYGDTTTVLAHESLAPRPVTAYGISHLTAEYLLLRYAHLNEFEPQIFRCANVYGQSQKLGRGQGLIPNVLASIRDDRVVTVYGDGNSTRDYIHVDDATEIISSVMTRPHPPEILNVGTGIGMNISEILATVANVTKRELRIVTKPKRHGDLSRCVLDVSQQIELTGFLPRPVSIGISDVWRSMSDVEP